jgi:propionate CoA-transferase
MVEFLPASDAVQRIPDHATLATCGFVGVGFPEALASALEARFVQEGHPCGLTLIYAAGQGDGGARGLNHFAHPKMIKRIIGGHWGLVPSLGRLALDNEVEAYNFPQGVISQLFRETTAKRPGLITHVGLNTFVDPRIAGGRMNTRTTEDLVEVLVLHGREWLFYKSVPISACLIRGTTADTDGNISMEKEAAYLEHYEVASATHNCGGLVIVQVERVTRAGALHPQAVHIPGVLVDVVVVADKAQHMMTFAEGENPSYSGECRTAVGQRAILPMDAKKLVSRRAILELRPGAVVNLGIGMPEGVAAVAAEENIDNLFTLTVESGLIGGIPAGGLSFGAAANPACMVNQPNQFDFYDGGGLDIAFLGIGQMDGQGNVNVSSFADRLPGCGGFINISQNAKQLVFMGTLTADGLKIDVADGRLKILQEGRLRKFVGRVDQITFSGPHARGRGQGVLYVTERAVFQLQEGGVVLSEIAPGIDPASDVMAHMDFAPLVSRDLREMDPRIFSGGRMALAG